jgi:hypothetical protein
VIDRKCRDVLLKVILFSLVRTVGILTVLWTIESISSISSVNFSTSPFYTSFSSISRLSTSASLNLTDFQLFTLLLMLQLDVF